MFLVGILGECEFGKIIDVVVVDYGYCFVIGVFYLFDFNEVLMDEFIVIFGIGWLIVGDIVVNCFYVDVVDVGVDVDVMKYV